MNQPKHKKRPLNGVLLLDKPVGLSSNSSLQKARHLFNAAKAGHTGVLDPLATGLLPVCFGEATKFAQYLLDADKAYIATLKLGEATTTGDAEGEVIATSAEAVDLADFKAACAALTGSQHQVPPMFSALKHDGRPLYEYARKGITIERKSRAITIYSIKITEFNPPQAMIEVNCSKGTYIRTLSEDIAKHCRTFAHLSALRRTATAGFHISQTHTFASLEILSEPERDALLLPCDELVKHLPSIHLSDADIRSLRFGQQPAYSGQQPLPDCTPIRAYSAQNEFIGLIEYLPRHACLKSIRLMHTAA